MRYYALFLVSLIPWLPFAHSAEDNICRLPKQHEEGSRALELANELFEQEKYEEAANAYAALEQKQDCPQEIWGMVVFNHGLSLSKLKRHDDAITEFKKILTSDVDDTEPAPNLMAAYRNYRYQACLQIARNYELSGRYADALKYSVLARDRFIYQSWCGTCLQMASEKLNKQIVGFTRKAEENNSKATDKTRYPIDMKRLVRRALNPDSCNPSLISEIGKWYGKKLISKDAAFSALLRTAEAHWHADGSDTNSKRRRQTAERAVWYLGHNKAAEAVPLLQKVMESSDESLRYAAAEAIVKIGGQALIPTVCRVFTDRKHFTSGHRFRMYDELSSYIGLKPWLEEFLIDREKTDVPPEVRSAVLSFLIAAADADVTTSGNTKRLDTMICLVSEQYRLSYERESILERLEHKWKDIPIKQGNPEARKYPTQQLEALRAIPSKKRTHVKVYRITPTGLREQNSGTEQPH